jgi:hypothetical protein
VKTCETSGSHVGVGENSNLLGCEALYLIRSTIILSIKQHGLLHHEDNNTTFLGNVVKYSSHSMTQRRKPESS